MVKRTIIFLIALLPVLHTAAQSRQAKKQIRMLFAEAKTARLGGEHLNAWTCYRGILALDSANGEAAAGAAEAMFSLRYPVDSARSFESALAKSRERGAPFLLARVRHQQRKFDEALRLLGEYEQMKPSKRAHHPTEIKYLRERCAAAKELIARPTGAIIRNIGPAINSKYQDYVPVIVPDESALYFTSKRENPLHTARNGDNTFFEDVYVSQRLNGKWMNAQSVGHPINTETNDACVAISPDGQRMIVYRTSEDQLSGDLFITTLGKNNRWSPLELMPGEINTGHIETSACFSNDSADIYFSSTMPGGLGGKDIYRIRRLPNGKWSKPFNLGANVNTPHDDDAPFLHPDGVTLYFSSRGHKGMGEYDVFRAVMNEERTGFGSPENLGYPINDVGNDIFFVVSVDGQRGYYSSVKEETYGDLDIYEIDTRFDNVDLKVRKGYAFLEGKADRVRITLLDAESGELQGTYLSNPDNGRFILVVNPLKRYDAIVEADDHETLELKLEPAAFDMKEESLKFNLKKKHAQ